MAMLVGPGKENGWEMRHSAVLSVGLAVAAPFTSRLGVVGSRTFETHGPRPQKVPGSDLIDFRERRRVKSKRTGQAE
jgi:hypothetical protein